MNKRIKKFIKVHNLFIYSHPGYLEGQQHIVAKERFEKVNGGEEWSQRRVENKDLQGQNKRQAPEYKDYALNKIY